MKNKLKKATLTTLSGAIIASNVPLNVFADALEEASEPKISETEGVLDLDVTEGEVVVEKLDSTDKTNERVEIEDNIEEPTQEETQEDNAEDEGIVKEDAATEGEVELEIELEGELEPSDSEDAISDEVLEMDTTISETIDTNQNSNEPVEQTTTDEGTIDKTQVVVNIPDATLKSSIKSALGITTENVTQADMERLTSLNIKGKGVSDLTGLEYAINITSLNARENDITDVTPLKGLTKLTHLWLVLNDIEDISALSELTELRLLDASYNNIKDISAVSKMTKLSELWVQYNEITDVTPVSELTQLGYLFMGYNNISDISSLSELTNLKQIRLFNNTIEDISVLSEMTKLTSLRIGSNNIKDISALAKLTELTTLELDNNQIKDISVLENLTKLTTLELYFNEIEDISVLSNFDKFTEMNLSYNKIKDISPLSHMTGLTKLYLMGNEIKNIEVLSGMTKLTTLSLDENQITNISALSELTGLQGLSLSGNEIKDISPLEGMSSLSILYLGDNQITNISVLSEMASLQMLSIPNNKIKDVSPLEGLSSLQILYLEGNTEIETNTLEELLASNQGIYILGISVNGKIDLSDSGIMGLTLKDSVIKNPSDIVLGMGVMQLVIEDSEVESLEFLKTSPYLYSIKFAKTKVNDYSTLNELENLRYVELVNNDALNLSHFRTLQENGVEVCFYDQHAKLDVNLIDNKVDNPFVDVDGSYITDINLPNGVKLSEDGSELVFENPIVGTSYELTAVSHLTYDALYYNYPTELKATFTISDLKTSKGEVVVTENKLSDTEKEISIEIIDAGYGIEKIILPDGTEVEGDKATFTVTESGEYEIKYTDTKGNQFTETITVVITPITPDVPEIDDTDKPTTDKPTEGDKEEVEKPTITENNAPVITGSDISIPAGYELDLEALVTVTDKEDGELKANVLSSNFNHQVSGTYQVVYTATDSQGLTTEKTIQITVRGNAEGNSSHSKDVIIKPNEKLDIDSIVDEIAKDKGLTDVEIIENNVDTTKPGDYKVVFEGTNIKKEQEIHSIKVTVSTGEPTDDSVETGIATGGMLSLGGLFMLGGIPFLKRKKK